MDSRLIGDAFWDMLWVYVMFYIDWYLIIQDLWKCYTLTYAIMGGLKLFCNCHDLKKY